MMFDLETHDTLYEALLAQDPSFEGRAYVCVKSTGIFCKFTCPARKPLKKNCLFRSSVSECLEDGYRPCKRCHPVKSALESNPDMMALLDDLETNPQKRWSEQDITARGLDASTVRRRFKREFGITFLEMARLKRLKEGFTAVSKGDPIIAAQLDAGFNSPSAFRDAFAKLLGCAPGNLQTNGLLRASWFSTPLGDMVAVGCASHIHLLEFIDRKGLRRELQALFHSVAGSMGLGETAPMTQTRHELDAYFDGKSARFSVPLKMHGTPFSQMVWRSLQTIPAGKTCSYADLARAIGRPTATRAVARANGANQIALLIPCHRVIGSDGSLTGYAGGLWRKKRLLDIEASHL